MKAAPFAWQRPADLPAALQALQAGVPQPPAAQA